MQPADGAHELVELDELVDGGGGAAPGRGRELRGAEARDSPTRGRLRPYTLLSLIIERVSGRSWRHEVTRRVIRPLRLTHTDLPTPGHGSINGPHAHGSVELDGQTIDATRMDPSFAGAAGGAALVTTVQDLARFLDAVLAGRMFRHRATLKQMLTIAPAQGEGGLVGYGLGIERRALPGGAQLIGHLGGAVYRSYVGRLHPTGVTIALALNAEDDPTPLLLPAVKALVAAHR